MYRMVSRRMGRSVGKLSGNVSCIHRWPYSYIDREASYHSLLHFFTPLKSTWQCDVRGQALLDHFFLSLYNNLQGIILMPLSPLLGLGLNKLFIASRLSPKQFLLVFKLLLAHSKAPASEALCIEGLVHLRTEAVSKGATSYLPLFKGSNIPDADPDPKLGRCPLRSAFRHHPDRPHRFFAH